MEEFPIILLTSLVSLILLWSAQRVLLKCRSTRKPVLPPSPPKLPIIGNLHQLSPLTHRDLHSLARKHGPLMLLHFGRAPVLIASSAHWAREIIRGHDFVFSNRPAYKAFEKLFYGCNDIVSSPYGEHWRKIKGIFVLHLLTSKRVAAFRSVREEETALCVKKIEECCDSAVNLSEMFAKVNNDGVCRSAFGKKYSESENGRKFLRVMADFTELLGFINIGDFVPWLGWIGRVNGFYKRLDATAGAMDQVLESVIQERLQTKAVDEKSGENNFLDILLGIYNDKSSGVDDDASIDRDSIKSLLLDVFIGGTATISTALEWAFSELLRDPTVMGKLQAEVRGIAKRKEEITDDDVEKMHYLKAVIKEAMRLHPPGPLLIPRVARQDVRIKGFDISAGTVLMINAWAIGRDTVSWDEPEKFKPERFLNSSIDFKGQDFELIPFGAGRRGCPGITYSVVAMELMLANLVKKFDWKLPNGVEAKDLDMNESPGLAVHRAVPLLAVASKAQ